MNQWQLPETKAHGSCNVTVQMKEGIPSDETSWLGVSSAAAQLNTAVSNFFGILVLSFMEVNCCLQKAKC